MYGGTKKALNLLLWATLATAGLYIALRWLLAWLAPFLIALVLARAIEPAVTYLCRQRWPRSLAAGICTIVLLSVTCTGLRFLIGGMIRELWRFTAQLPGLMEGIVAIVGRAERWIMTYIDQTGGGFGDYLRGVLDSLPTQLSNIPAALSAGILSFLSGFAGKAPSIIMFTVTACLGVYFISAAYPELRRFLGRQIPLRWKSRVRDLQNDLESTMGHWLKAQLIMSGITFGELLLAFILLRVDYALLLALVVAVIDALPVLGAGTALLPWAAAEFLVGNYSLGLGLAITYAVITLLRQCFQAKLLGDQLGLHPVASLLSVYVGFRVMGIWGMILFPIFFITVKQLNDKGVLRLWRTEESPRA